MKKIKKYYIEKNYCNPQCFQGKNYKAKFQTSLIFLKIKLTKFFLKTIIKKTKGKKNHTGKHCSNLYRFMRKHIVIILNQLNIKNNKINKDNFEKKPYKKIMWRNIVAIHSVLKKKTTKLNSQPV